MPIPIEQAIYSNAAGGGYRFLARSEGFHDDWLPEAERLCTGFGERPAGVACPLAVFAHPFGPKHVAVVQVADQGQDEAGRPGALAFRILVLPMKEYGKGIGDPFLIADRFVPDWRARDWLPTLDWPDEPLPRRTVEATQQVLKSGDSPTLLGGVQALVDGGRMVYERPAPAADLVRGIWSLLPQSTRAYLWPATFAFGNTLDFDLLAVPRADPRDFAGYLTEEQAGDYPQGHYELNLQIAAESGDQYDLDRLFERRSSGQTLRLALILVAVMAVLAVVSNALQQAKQQAAAPATKFVAPPLPERYPPLGEAPRKELTQALEGLAEQLQIRPLPEPATAEALLSAIDRKLGSPGPERDCGPIAKQGDAERQLRALLWKQQVARFDDPKLTVVELVEKLQEHVKPIDSK